VVEHVDRLRTVAVCGAKDCRGRAGHADLLAQLTSGDVPCRVVETRCLDVCSGPVVVVGVGERKPRVFRKLRGRKQRRDLTAVVAGASMTDRLRAIRVTGASARRAVSRIRPR